LGGALRLAGRCKHAPRLAISFLREIAGFYRIAAPWFVPADFVGCVCAFVAQRAGFVQKLVCRKPF
jgi:hypothetical protein